MSINDREKELLKGLASNEKGAIEAIYRDNYQLIQQLVIHNNGTEDDARDVFQEALIVLLLEKDWVPERRIRQLLKSEMLIDEVQLPEFQVDKALTRKEQELLEV